jgi:hypothetical protein
VTAQEVEDLGKEDPIPWEYASDAVWTLESDFAKVQQICRQCALDDTKLNDWFGVCNANRARARKLFQNGHLDWSTLRVREARLLVNKNTVFLFQAAVTASQRVRSYCTLLAYDATAHQTLRSPASSCECVVHLGPGCSHQMSIACTIVLFSLLDATELKLLPSHVAALQRVAMTISYAYGFNSVKRDKILAKVRLPCAVSVQASGMDAFGSTSTATRARDTPEPMCKFVQDLLASWRRQYRRRVPTVNDLSIEKIQADTDQAITQYPRTPDEQLRADLMRERLFEAYKSKAIRGWDDDTPPLDLYYLVHTRKQMIERINAADHPAPVCYRYYGDKRCSGCDNVVKGRNTRVCPNCNQAFPTTQPLVTTSFPEAVAKNGIKHVLALYDQLPGRWNVQAWTDCDGFETETEQLRVRLMGDEGMIGQYTKRLHEPGDAVQIKQDGAWLDATVKATSLEEYSVECAGASMKVSRVSIRDCPGTVSNSTFRIQKGPRSVTLVKGGKRVRKRVGGRGNGSTGHCWESQWSLTPKSTAERLVWCGGGNGTDVEIIWVKDTTARTAATIVFAVPGAISRLPRKRSYAGKQHCACGDRACNTIMRRVGTVLQERCTWTRPQGRPAKNLNSSQKRKAVRIKAMNDQVEYCPRPAPPPHTHTYPRTHTPGGEVAAHKPMPDGGAIKDSPVQ